MHSKNFSKIKGWYDKGIYSKYNVKMCVVKGQITPDEYAEITGDVYSAPNAVDLLEM